MIEPIIEINNVKKYFSQSNGFFSIKKKVARAIDDISLNVNKGEIVGLIGESGSGKTTLARLILGLTKATGGSVTINGTDMTKAKASEIKKVRSQLAVVLQDPASNLNPRQTVESSIMRPMIINGVSKEEAKKRAKEALIKVKMDTAYLNSYPHQLSGGQQQRIAIARALVLKPKIMILDEPTSALDISVQAQVLNLLLDLQEEFNLTYVIVTHDLNVIRYVSDKVAVMYLGKLVEFGETDDVLKTPIHPYTRVLMGSAPIMNPKNRKEEKLIVDDEPGGIMDVPLGCRFAPRCEFSSSRCKDNQPEFIDNGNGHFSACFCTGKINKNK